METQYVEISYRSRADTFKIYPLGCIHAGTIFCQEQDIKQMVKRISQDKFARWVGMGDMAECITPGDPRWDVKAIAKWVEQSNVAESQRQWIVNLFKPIASQCLGILTGNHEESIRLQNYQDIHLDICRDLGVKDLGYSCFIRLSFCRVPYSFVTFDCHFEHGSGGAQTEGGKMMRLVKGMMAFDADIYGMGHLHDIKTNVIPQLYLDGGMKIKQRLKVGALTGSWFKAYQEGPYPSYAERKGLNPVNLGCPVYTITPDKRIITVQGIVT